MYSHSGQSALSALWSSLVGKMLQSDTLRVPVGTRARAALASSSPLCHPGGVLSSFPCSFQRACLHMFWLTDLSHMLNHSGQTCNFKRRKQEVISHHHADDIIPIYSFSTHFVSLVMKSWNLGCSVNFVVLICLRKYTKNKYTSLSMDYLFCVVMSRH